MEIKPYDNNAKKHPNKQLLALAKIVKEVGWRQPVIVNQQGTIVVGHGRWMAYEMFGEKMGLKEIWVVDDKGQTIMGEPDSEPLTPEQEKTYRLADNKLNEADWDMELATEELKTLNEAMLDLTGFDKNLVLETQEDDPSIDVGAISEPVTHPGDVYQMGKHKLICPFSSITEYTSKRSSEEGDIVLDAFAGSGSTMIACEQLKRKCYMIELDPKYCDAILSRWVQYNGTNSVIKNGKQITWEI